MSQYIKKLQDGGSILTQNIFKTPFGEYEISPILQAIPTNILRELDRQGHMKKSRFADLNMALNEFLDSAQAGNVGIDAAGRVYMKGSFVTKYPETKDLIFRAFANSVKNQSPIEKEEKQKVEKRKYNPLSDGMRLFNQEFLGGSNYTSTKGLYESISNWYYNHDDTSRNTEFSQFLQTWYDSLDPNLDYSDQGGYEKVKENILKAKTVFDKEDATDALRMDALSKIGFGNVAQFGLNKPKEMSNEDKLKLIDLNLKDLFKKQYPTFSDELINELVENYKQQQEVVFNNMKLLHQLQIEQSQKALEDYNWNLYKNNTYSLNFIPYQHSLLSIENRSINTVDEYLNQKSGSATNGTNLYLTFLSNPDLFNFSEKVIGNITQSHLFRRYLDRMIQSDNRFAIPVSLDEYILTETINSTEGTAWIYNNKSGILLKVNHSNSFLDLYFRKKWIEALKKNNQTQKKSLGGTIKELRKFVTGGDTISVSNNDTVKSLSVQNMDSDLLKTSQLDSLLLKNNPKNEWTVDIYESPDSIAMDSVLRWRNEYYNQPYRSDDGKVWDNIPWYDLMRVGAAGADAAIGVSTPILLFAKKKSPYVATGALLASLLTTLANTAADFGDPAISNWQATKNLAANTAMDFASVAGFGERIKFLKATKRLIPILTSMYNAGYLALDERTYQALNKLKFSTNTFGDLTPEDVKIISNAVSAAAGVATGLTSFAKARYDRNRYKTMTETVPEIMPKAGQSETIIRYKTNVGGDSKKTETHTKVITQEDKIKLDNAKTVDDKNRVLREILDDQNAYFEQKWFGHGNDVSKGSIKTTLISADEPIDYHVLDYARNQNWTPNKWTGLMNFNSWHNRAVRSNSKQRVTELEIENLRSRFKESNNDTEKSSNTSTNTERPTETQNVSESSQESHHIIVTPDDNVATGAQRKNTSGNTRNKGKNRRRKHKSGGTLDYIRSLRNFTSDDTKSSRVLSKHSKGGIVKAASGIPSPDVEDPEDPNKNRELNKNVAQWYLLPWKLKMLIGWKPSLSMANWLTTSDNHHKYGDLTSAYNTNQAYTNNKNLVEQDINYFYDNYYTKPTDNTLDAFIKAYNSEIDSLNKTWYDNDNHKYNNRGWTLHGERFKKLYNSRSVLLTNDNKSYNLSWDERTKDILGSTMWQRRGDIYEKKYNELDDELKKNRIHYVNGLGWVYKQQNGYIAKLSDDEITRLGLLKTNDGTKQSDPNQLSVATENVDQSQVYNQDEALTQQKPEENSLIQEDDEVIRMGNLISNPKSNKYENTGLFTDIAPEILANSRLMLNLLNNARLMRYALRKLPSLMGYVNRHRYVYNDKPLEDATQQQANELVSQVGRPRTSDAMMNVAQFLEAQNKANQSILQSRLASNNRMYDTGEKQLALLQGVNDENKKVKDFNSAALTEDHNRRLDVKAATRSANTTNLDTRLQEIEYRIRERLADNKANQRYLDERYIAQQAAKEAANNPEYRELQELLAKAYSTEGGGARARVIMERMRDILNQYSDQLWKERYRLYGLRRPKTSYDKRGGTIDDSDVKKRQKDHDRLVKEILHTITHHLKALDNLSKGQFLSIKKLLS